MSTFNEERRHREAVEALDAAAWCGGVRWLAQVERLAGDILTPAADVFGSREAAAEWFMQPAMALDRKRPIDLLGTAAGREQVELLLIRLHYGVYT